MKNVDSIIVELMCKRDLSQEQTDYYVGKAIEFTNLSLESENVRKHIKNIIKIIYVVDKNLINIIG